jgi:CRP-like cAMP-binding protein
VKQLDFDEGQLILEQGQPSDVVYQILTGEVEVFTRHENLDVVLGTVTRGDFLGEMGAIEHRPRSASARASSHVRAVQLERWEFVKLISEEPLSAHRLITRLSERLRLVNERLVESSESEAVSTPEAPAAAAEAAKADLHPVVHAGSSYLAAAIPREGIEVTESPFRVGRTPEPYEPKPAETVHLSLADSLPFRLSREHFSLYRGEDGYAIRDLGSTLGTEVNGTFLGEHFGTDTELLEPGENIVIAGGIDSPFQFKIVVE